MVGDWLCQGDPSLSLYKFWVSTSTFTCTTLANQSKSLVHLHTTQNPDQTKTWRDLFRRHCLVYDHRAGSLAS